MNPAPDKATWLACSRSPAFFLHTCAQVYDPATRGWTRFRLWPSQVRVVDALHRQPLTVILKARQLGISWLSTGYALWLMLFRPAATVLLFSQRDDEAVHLLNFRLRGMYERLPRHLRARGVLRDNSHEFRLSNGSAALAFPTTGGRSYTATLAIVDETDHADDLDALLNAVKPTIDGGGRLVLLSTVDKTRPNSPFKRIYRAATRGENGFAPVFLPWRARPERDDAWYAAQQADVLARTGGLDDLLQEYPATDLEALAPRATDKLFPATWLNACYTPRLADTPLTDGVPADGAPEGGAPEDGAPAGGASTRLALPGLTVHAPPWPGREYVIGADPAEGSPHGDESAAVVLDVLSGAQVATLGVRCDPARFASLVAALGRAYNEAPVLVERNNHGHAVLLWLAEHSGLELLRGLDKQPGWLTTGASKPLALDYAGEVLREGAVTLCDDETYLQLASIEGGALAAPRGAHDDRAMALVLALAAIRWCGLTAGPAAVGLIPPAWTPWPDAEHV